MKKGFSALCLALLVAALVALPGAAWSAMWVGGQIGGNHTKPPDAKMDSSFGELDLPGLTVAPSVIGGVMIGYDFVNTGFLGRAWPDWMKYFSIATDFTYNRMDLRDQPSFRRPFQVTQFIYPIFVTTTGTAILTVPRIEGYMAVWSFLLMAHYGFLPDSEVPGGRLLPYIGVGPGIVFSGLDLGPLGATSSVNVALVTEVGLRYMALKNVSLDLGFRYRYTRPTYDFTDQGGTFTGVVGANGNFKFDAIHTFSFLFRANYHF